MKVKEVKELMKLFADPKYDDYNVVFWDFTRQKAMDGHFGGLSHPEKEISIPISVVGERYAPRVKVDGLAEIVPSPFKEGKNAYLRVDHNAEMSGVKYDRYFYECEETGNQFSTTLSETYTLCSFYCEECKRLRNILKSKEMTEEEIWEKINTRVTES